MEAIVNRIIPFSSVDGPGNRTAVFLQGCNFDCMYCHNPETIQFCRQCKRCLAVCPTGAISQNPVSGAVEFDPKRCCGCDSCIRTCPYNSSPRTVRMSAEQVMEEVRKNIPFIRGMTVSGGECTMQRDFLKELFSLAKKEGLHCLIDSNGSYDFGADAELMAVTDGVMLDLKAFSPQEHEKITGASNGQVLENAVLLAQMGKLTEIRTVVVPGLFDGSETVREAVKLLLAWQDRSPTRYKLISYRPMGVRTKYRYLRTPTREEMEQLECEARSLGWKRVVTT